MAIITISRQIGSFGDEIAEKIADQLGYQFVEKGKLYELASDFKGDYSKEMDVLSRESKPGFFDSFFTQRTAYFHLMASMIFDFAGRNNIVVKGRGGQFLLRDMPFVINARIKAPFDLRVARVAKTETVDEDTAAVMVKKSDNSCEEFNRYLYKKNIADNAWYDVIFDTSRIPQANIIDFIINETVRIENETPMTEADKTKYKCLALEKRIEIALMKEMTDSNYIKVHAKGDGQVILAGYLSTDTENEMAQRIVSGINGVEKVDNKIVVSQYPVKLWH